MVLVYYLQNWLLFLFIESFNKYFFYNFCVRSNSVLGALGNT